jgi:2-hydroxy-3-oxopropionate reductase
MGVNTRIGFIGLGVMGAPMAARFVTAGYPVTVTTRSPERAAPVLNRGAVWAESAREVAAKADVLITMLPDTPDVQHVGEEVIAAADEGTCWIDMSTISPIAWRELAERSASHGVHAVDAPVSGGEKGAIDGTLTIMVGADPDDFDAVRELLTVLGSPALIGGVGAGQIAKACNQVITAGTIGLVAEALTIAESSGVDPRRVRDALLGGFAASRILEVHGLRMLDGDHRPGFQSQLHRKDVGIAFEQAAETGTNAPFTAVSARLLDGAISRGDGARDSIVVHSNYGELTQDIRLNETS